MEPIITVNQYPIGWEWIDRVPLEDFTWLIEIFSTMTDNTDTYDFATFDKEATNGEPPYPVIEINRKGLAHFMNDDHLRLTIGIAHVGTTIFIGILVINSTQRQSFPCWFNLIFDNVVINRTCRNFQGY